MTCHYEWDIRETKIAAAIHGLTANSFSTEQQQEDDIDVE
jgi:hypothetical protein